MGVVKNVRIGSGAGYGGDRIDPAIDLLINGELDYVIFECLAERTIALANKEKFLDPLKGFSPLSITRFEKILDAYESHFLKTKIITNMGAANPIALAHSVKKMCDSRGLNLKVAAIIGDDVFNQLDLNSTILETGELLRKFEGRILSANAYIGVSGILKALNCGADIIIGGRIADPSLTLAPLIYSFNWDMFDYDLLAKGTCVGHLLECAAQVCGGYYFDGNRKLVPGLEALGFPFAEVNSMGDFTIQKLGNSGGVINEMTVKEQLLYEIMDPSNYFTPDVIMDISKAFVTQKSENKVSVSNIYGKKPTKKLKVSVGISDGYISESEISYGGHHALARAQESIKILKYRLSYLSSTTSVRYDLIGVNSLFPNESPEEHKEVQEIRLRVACKAENIEIVKIVCQEVEALYTNGPAGGGGVRNHIETIVSIVSILINHNSINEEVYIQ